MEKGTIQVKTENIFPIIKKFLYSDHEIFLRELISNAVDATQKLKTLVSLGKYKEELGDTTIVVEMDQKARTITVKDRGIGMTADEVDRYINQIAFSSAEEFLKKFKGKSEDEARSLIGHFGLGFYSTFMVSDKVEILTKTYKKGAGSRAVRWECDGSPEYTIDFTDKEDRGTIVTLHIAKDSDEFLNEYRILDLLKKYCKFLPVPIIFGTEKTYEPVEGEKDEHGHEKTKEVEKPRIINNTNPAWRRKPSELKEEDYRVFYRELYPATFDEPLFNIHLNVDYPFNLTGILYFPKITNYLDVRKDKIQLYCNQVYVTDSVEGIVPDFLALLHGVIDSPDIPLNVSRSYLQSDASVKKISSHITKKVSDRLEEIFKNNREDFEKKWEDIKLFIEYGMISDEKFYERARTFTLLKNTEGRYFTLDDYAAHIKDTQTDKDKKLIYLYASNVSEQHGYIGNAKERGFDVLVMDGPLDPHFINALEMKLENSHFTRVDADVIDKLIKKEEEMPSKLSDNEKETLKTIFEKTLDKDKFMVILESLSEKDPPVSITQPEFMRRMKDMSKLGGGMPFMKDMPEHYNFVINTNHPVITKLMNTNENEEKDRMTKQLKDLALLSQQMLTGEDLTNFVKRSVEILL
ncbi:MAG: molecular chaperone HtpG [Bacteroidales bacterium]|nr:molecular chaperone HtpG [Bacteroidales bacterium]